MYDVRSLAPLLSLRQRRHAVVACLDDPSPLEAAGERLAGLCAELVVERAPGPLSAGLGRPSVTVASRFGWIARTGTTIDGGRVPAALGEVELACARGGPQAWGGPG